MLNKNITFKALFVVFIFALLFVPAKVFAEVVEELPSVAFLGEGPGTYHARPGERILVKRRYPTFEFVWLDATTYTTTSDIERVWSSSAPFEDDYHTVLNLGLVNKGAVVSYVAIDDDDDGRLNKFMLDGTVVHTMSQGMVTEGSFEITQTGELTLDVQDSIGSHFVIDEPDPVPVPDPTFEYTASARALCLEDNEAVIAVSFQNSKSNPEGFDVNVTPTDRQTGVTGETKYVDVGETKNWELRTGRDSLRPSVVSLIVSFNTLERADIEVTVEYLGTSCTDPVPVPDPEPRPEPSPDPEIKDESFDIEKKVRLEGDDDWKEKVTGVEQGQVVEFAIKVVNTGDVSRDDMRMEDMLPDEMERVGGDGLTEYWADFEPGEKKTFKIKAVVKDSEYEGSVDKCIVNTAKVEVDHDQKATDSATVCYDNVEISELPETGASHVIGLVGLISTGLGLGLRKRLAVLSA